MTTTPPLVSTLAESEFVADWTNASQETTTGLHYYRVMLLRHPNGRHYLYSVGGPRSAVGQLRWLEDASEARQFILDHCTDYRTGCGYTESEADALLAGELVEGTRSLGGQRLPRPEAWGF
jgi:hypothetical protein